MYVYLCEVPVVYTAESFRCTRNSFCVSILHDSLDARVLADCVHPMCVKAMACSRCKLLDVIWAHSFCWQVLVLFNTHDESRLKAVLEGTNPSGPVYFSENLALSIDDLYTVHWYGVCTV